MATAATILATVTVGRLADRTAGYRRYAMLATTLLAATGFTLAVINSWDPVIACAFALGAGYGAYQSVSSALSLTVLPDQASAARDLGIINIASSIPQVIGPSVAALVITVGLGYRGLFAFAGPARPGRLRRLLPRAAPDQINPWRYRCPHAGNAMDFGRGVRRPATPPRRREATRSAHVPQG